MMEPAEGAINASVPDFGGTSQVFYNNYSNYA